MTAIRNNFRHTINACYIGYIMQAIVNNFAPLLFLTFASEFHLELRQITLITTVNFGVQLTIDALSAKLIDKIGYRTSIVAGHLFSGFGLCGLTLLPSLLPSAYSGIIIAVMLYAVGGGVTEVLISPIVEHCPIEEKRKASAMSLLHSFYCWGFMAVILLSTLFFATAGIAHWRVLALLWAIIPFANALYFCFVPIFMPQQAHENASHKQTGSVRALLKNGLFWLLAALMVASGASEHAIGQWVSSFAESALHVSKTTGDLAGPCLFAFMQGLSRALYGKWGEKISLRRIMLICAVLCSACYIVIAIAPSAVIVLAACAISGLAIGLFWPGTFSLSASMLKGAGTAMFALLALAGDIGCAAGPTLAGFVAAATGGELRRGIAAAIIFPLIMLFGLLTLRYKSSAASSQ